MLFRSGLVFRKASPALMKPTRKIIEIYTAVYNSQKEVTKVDKTGEVGEFNNYKLGTLPSTGGIGTYLFYIVGAVLVVLAGSMLVRHRKKDRTHHDENSH